MHFEFLLEEESAEAALRFLVPKILGPEPTFRIHVFQGKRKLLANLESRLRGYASRPGNWRVVVLVDEDREDCHAVKQELEVACLEAGLITKTEAEPGQGFQVLNRIAIEELEAWFFGDVHALCTAYPGVPATLANRAKFRVPDAIAGGTWEALEEVLQRAGYHRGGLAKITAARDIAPHMDPNRNTSESFRCFVQGLVAAREQGAS